MQKKKQEETFTEKRNRTRAIGDFVFFDLLRM